MWKYECVTRQEFESIKDKIEQFIVMLGGNEVSVDLPCEQRTVSHIIKQHENCNYLADTRTGFENVPEDTRWVADYFMPTAAANGCKCIYFIIDEANSLKEELEGQKSDASDKIAFKYIYSLKKWIKGTKYEQRKQDTIHSVIWKSVCEQEKHYHPG